MRSLYDNSPHLPRPQASKTVESTSTLHWYRKRTFQIGTSFKLCPLFWIHLQFPLVQHFAWETGKLSQSLCIYICSSSSGVHTLCYYYLNIPCLPSCLQEPIEFLMLSSTGCAPLTSTVLKGSWIGRRFTFDRLPITNAVIC